MRWSRVHPTCILDTGPDTTTTRPPHTSPKSRRSSATLLSGGSPGGDIVQSLRRRRGGLAGTVGLVLAGGRGLDKVVFGAGDKPQEPPAVEPGAGFRRLGPLGGAAGVGQGGEALVEPGVNGHHRPVRGEVCLGVADQLPGDGELTGLAVGDGQESGDLVEGAVGAAAVGQLQRAGEVVDGGVEMPEPEVGQA